MVRSPDRNTDFFDIVTGALQEDTLASYLFIYLPRLRTSNIDRSNKRKWLYARKRKKQGADNILQKLWQTQTTQMIYRFLEKHQAESLQHRLEQTAGGVGFHVNANKTEYMCLKQEEAISTLSGKQQKLVDKFM